MRYRIDLSYDGTRYSGWQKQPNAISIQQTLEQAFSTILREPIEIVGCGRTDAGVHATMYVAHCDIDRSMDLSECKKAVYQLNSILPYDIAIHMILPVWSDFHARFDAEWRRYVYRIHPEKDPFKHNRSFLFRYPEETFDYKAVDEAAALLMKYTEFKPFCKTGSDEKHYQCELFESSWFFSKDFTYTIRANRFLRGMVRMIVGACLNVGLGKLQVKDIEYALDNQVALPVQWSVPAEGLYLDGMIHKLPSEPEGGGWVAYPV